MKNMSVMELAKKYGLPEEKVHELVEKWREASPVAAEYLARCARMQAILRHEFGDDTIRVWMTRNHPVSVNVACRDADPVAVERRLGRLMLQSDKTLKVRAFAVSGGFADDGSER